MDSNTLLRIVDATIMVLTFSIIIRSLLSFFVDPRSAIYEFFYTVTEPMIAPLRTVMPRMGMFDLSPMAAVLILQFVIHPIARAALSS